MPKYDDFKRKAQDATRKAQRRAGDTPTPEFLNGRYGADQLSRFIFIIALVCFVLAFLPHLHFFTWIGFAALVVGFFRMFSKNHRKRMEENRAYQKWMAGIKAKMGRKNAGGRTSEPKVRQDPDVRLLLCPQCNQKIRVPRVSGTIRVICPNCKHEFYLD